MTEEPVSNSLNFFQDTTAQVVRPYDPNTALPPAVDSVAKNSIDPIIIATIAVIAAILVVFIFIRRKKKRR